MIDLVRLERFVVLARVGNYRRAADELNLSQPALSRSIESLERTCGATLLDRGRKGAIPTPTGRRLLQLAEELVESAKSLDQLLNGVSRGLRGTVAFAMGPGVATTVMPRFLARLFQEYPEISVRCEIGSFDTMLSELESGRLEFFVGRLTQVSSRIITEPLGQSSGAWLVRDGHPLLAKERVSYADIENYRRMSTTASNEDLLGRMVDVPRALIADVEIDNYGIMVDTAVITDAIILGPLELRDERLHPVRLAESESAPRQGTIALYKVRGRRLTAVANVVTDLIRKEVASLHDAFEAS